METSILYTIKEMLDVEPSNNDFDEFILVGINSALMALTQLGVGKREDFVVKGIEETWDDFLGDESFYAAVKMFVYIKTRLVFDPPANSFVVNSFQDQLKEYEWRIAVRVDERRAANEEAAIESGSCPSRNQRNEMGSPKNSRAVRA